MSDCESKWKNKVGKTEERFTLIDTFANPGYFTDNTASIIQMRDQMKMGTGKALN